MGAKPTRGPGSGSFKVLIFELGGQSDLVTFGILAGLMFCFMLLNGFAEEFVVKAVFQKQYPNFIALARFTCSGVLALMERAWKGESSVRRGPIRDYVAIAVSLALSMMLTQYALVYTIYPVKILFKSSKAIPVMLISALVFGKSYSLKECGCVFVLVSGIALFAAEEAGIFAPATPAESSDSKIWLGILLMTGAVMADGFLSNLSANTFAMHRASQAEVMMFQNFGGGLLLLPVACISGDLVGGARLCLEQGMGAAGPLVIFAASNFVGGYFVLSLSKRFGAVIMTLTSTARKAVQITLSYVLFPDDKQLRTGHGLGVALFLVGLIGLNFVRAKTKRKKG